MSDWRIDELKRRVLEEPEYQPVKGMRPPLEIRPTARNAVGYHLFVYDITRDLFVCRCGLTISSGHCTPKDDGQ